MAWVYTDYPEDYPKTREEAIMRAMSVSEEDIDYSDIPPLELREGVRVVPVGNKFKEMSIRNCNTVMRLLRELEEIKATQNNHTNE